MPKQNELTISFLNRRLVATLGGCILTLLGITSAQAQLAFQGFETNTGDWTDITGVPGSGIARVPSGGGVLGVSSAAGNYHAEITNEPDTYQPGTGYGEYSFFGFAVQPPFPGNFSQSVSMYVNANWAPSPFGQPGVWIDMQPGNPDFNNSGAEHNFRLTTNGTSVAITVDGQVTPILTITTSGWYQFQMTYRKGATPTDLVTTVMNIFDNSPTPNLLASTTVVSNSVSVDGPLLSANLEGPGYVWVTVWADGFANNVLAIDNARADLLLVPGNDTSFQVSYAANLDMGESNIDIANTGFNGAAALGPGFGGNTGNICVNVYAIDPGEELISCCSCMITPDATADLGVVRDLTSNTQTGAAVTSVTVKLYGTLPVAGAAPGTVTCNSSAAGGAFAGAAITNGLAAWGTTLHAVPSGSYATTERPFTSATLSASELASLQGRCAGIIGNASGFGVCASCRAGALGASKF